MMVDCWELKAYFVLNQTDVSSIVAKLHNALKTTIVQKNDNDTLNCVCLLLLFTVHIKGQILILDIEVWENGNQALTV